ncbi:ASCH domain-containing protein [Vagococcus sp. DIV0080]|uniref:ASCH domain-containing protein n=1 Tax=Candidatus Vagococcus giribetii TaxID=2230876 RepID=A0ABS3HVD1_9ENTE|nr:ASCH domain-containing protein [Vagococcus sp. DIV0080]MBO0477660.1 ASCH domain-containing protein [Vagococcus sp. DIV0080]
MKKVVRFGSERDEQTYLAHLVLDGVKIATSSLKELQELMTKPKTSLNDRWIIQNGWAEEVCQVDVTTVELIPFGEVTERFAIDEGDGSYENWYNIHSHYYQQLLNKYDRVLSDETILECVYFKLITKKP